MKKPMLYIKKITAIIITALMLVAVLLSVSMSSVAAAGKTTVAVNDSNIRYLGHWDRNGSTSVTGYFESCIEVKFTGTSFKVNVSSSKGNGLSVSIDGGAYKNFNANKSPSFTGLSNANHKAVIYCEFQGVNPTIKSFEIDAGAKLLPPDNNKIMAVIGDSISAAWFEDKLTSSVTHSFSTLLPAKLGYAGAVTAIGGGKIVDDEKNANDYLGMINRYFMMGEKGSDKEHAKFDASSFKPDYIVIELGTNDSGNVATVRNAYVEGLKKLRKQYPNVIIFCLTPFMNKNVDAVKGAVEVMRESNDLKVRYIDATGLESAEKIYAGSGHPSYKGQEFIAESLYYTIKRMIAKNGGVAENENEDLKISSDDGDPDYIPGGGLKKKKVSTTSQDDKTATADSGTKGKSATSSKAKKSNKDTKKVTSTYVNEKGETVTVEKEVDEDGNVVYEDVADEKSEDGGIMDYLWILILAVAVVIIGLLIVIFLPQIKKLFNKNK